MCYYHVFLQYLDIWLTLLILQMRTWGSGEVQGLSAAWPELGSLPCPPWSPGGSSVLGQRPAAPFHTDALRDSGEGQWWEENQRLIQVLSFPLYIDVSPHPPLSKLFSPLHPWPGMHVWSRVLLETKTVTSERPEPLPQLLRTLWNDYTQSYSFPRVLIIPPANHSTLLRLTN